MSEFKLEPMPVLCGGNRPIALVDLDNCISNDKWRWPFFDLHLPKPNDRYWRYHDGCGKDEVANLHIIRLLQRNHNLIVTTSRPEVVRYKTINWLRKWDIPTIKVLMRPNENHDPSVVLKRKMLHAILAAGYEVQSAIDDRTDILDMYADEGVRCCHRVFINAPENEHP